MTIDYSKIRYNVINPKYAQEGLEKMMDILKDFQIWLDYGTLLGAIREQKFMAHDYDVDLGVHIEQTEEIYTYKQELAKAGILMSRAESREQKILFMFNLLYKNTKIDLYVWHPRENTYRKARGFHKDVWVYSEVAAKHYSKLDKIDFLGKQYYIPSLAEEHLTTMYGDWKEPILYSCGEGGITRKGREF